MASLFLHVMTSDDVHSISTSDLSMQLFHWCSEARRGYTHLGTYFFTQSQARRIEALLNKHLSNFELCLTFNFTDCFGGKSFALDPQQQLTNSLQALPCPLLLGTLHSNVYHQCIQQSGA